MQLTPRDDRIWKEDPEEYIRKQEDFTVSHYNIKNTANDMLLEICKKKDGNNTLYLLHFLTYAQSALSS